MGSRVYDSLVLEKFEDTKEVIRRPKATEKIQWPKEKEQEVKP